VRLKKKKEREQKKEGEEKKLSPFVCRGPSRKAILQLLQLAGKASLVPLTLSSAHTCTLDCLTLLTVYTSTYKSERVFMGCIWKRFESQQQRRVSAPDDESKRQTNP